jgi:hypothetical protein
MDEDGGVDSNSDASDLDAMDEDEDEDEDDNEEEDEYEDADNDDVLQEQHLRTEIESYIKAFGRSLRTQSVEKYPVDLIGMDGMVMRYLVENGYSGAAEAFQSEAFLTNLDKAAPSSSFAGEFPLFSEHSAMNQTNLFGVKARASVIDAILRGDITKAYAEIEHLDSTIFAER